MMRTLMAVTILICLFGPSAEARSRHPHHHYYRYHHYHQHYHHYHGRHQHYAGSQERGAAGTCARRSAAIPDHPIVLRDRGPTMGRMRMVRLSEQCLASPRR
jgi:hypothetical protein